MAAIAPAPQDTAGAGDVRPASLRHPGRGRRRGSAFPPLRGFLPLALVLIIWELLPSEGSVYFPPPSEWIDGLRRLWSIGRLWPAAVETLSAFAIALAVAALLGTLLGLVVGASRNVDRALGPTLEFARAMPPAAVAPSPPC